MKTQIIYILFAILAGAVLPLLAGLNVQLGKSVQQPIFAAFASFITGTIGLLIYLLVLKFDFASISQSRSVSPFIWIAGILGAFYIAAVIVLAPTLGTALTFSLIVAGQMTISFVFDHFGLLRLPVKEINWQRFFGIAFLIVWVILIRKF
jgi:transporter family-2 protein